MPRKIKEDKLANEVQGTPRPGSCTFQYRSRWAPTRAARTEHRTKTRGVCDEGTSHADPDGPLSSTCLSFSSSLALRGGFAWQRAWRWMAEQVSQTQVTDGGRLTLPRARGRCAPLPSQRVSREASRGRTAPAYLLLVSFGRRAAGLSMVVPAGSSSPWGGRGGDRGEAPSAEYEVDKADLHLLAAHQCNLSSPSRGSEEGLDRRPAPCVARRVAQLAERTKLRRPANLGTG